MSLTKTEHAMVLLLAASNGHDIRDAAGKFLRSLPLCKTEGCTGHILGAGQYCSRRCRAYTAQVAKDIEADRRLQTHKTFTLGADNDNDK
jgi:hypothetical protein